jgi:transcriptional regulator with XRE-family HTH domain
VATNQQIGDRIGLSHSGVSRIRSGGRVPLLPTMLRIEQATGWSVEEQSRAAAQGRYAEQFEQRVASYEFEPA